MKRISIETLRELAAKNPTAWHQLISAGQLEPDLKVLAIDEAEEARILNGQSLPVVQVKSQVRSAAEIARLQAICTACSWNINWICEHPGCKPCRQRRAGGLKSLITDPNARCPAGEWR
jgi:hypothetical protein